MKPSTVFTLPADADAHEPPEARGSARDEVRLLVASPSGLTSTRFGRLPAYLEPGDLVVVNTSATLPAAVDGHRPDGTPVVIHFSAPRGAGWVVEVRVPDGSGPVLDGVSGERIAVPGGAGLTLREPADERAHGVRLWTADVALEGPVEAWLNRHGRPITYSYLHGRWPLSDYQPVFAREPGSAEMASAGRPFTDRLVTDLVTRGVAVAPVLLHTGVSSPEAGEGPQTEWFRVPAATARLVRSTRDAGGRVVAVGTTVTRALESAVDETGRVRAAEGWTDLVIGPDHPPRVVNGLVTGWHTPEASHLLLLEAVAGPGLVQAAYRAAVAERYRWHEFGDSCLLLP
ncbi:S-adenosylmethionine:tRNA ribosyltransferase-isomerase [Cryptosporangium arvum]|uniref:S-adenosylmethionine:tRNA-ribosyltransferase-isomerase (Queuine synthetase) n=1 Tax=Cryptosporangium arvum DSM 44712 TaxID=927661 RepID=A0A010ZNL9_9ACTN|nr:S-adenosylmethionine:tRNA ribosyltransferase-isomerase [Cryptosporangium arvum]EXG80259.1 S-adenosylmethionine:tRNA-ribosyltransferase-isomerase (queuine synthetase) [Cryptosporangium arvum DSM 44712]